MATETDLQRLIVQMEARNAKFEKDLAKATGIANRSATQIETRFKGMNTKLTTGVQAFGAAFTKAFAIAGISVGAAMLPRLIGDIVSEASGLVKTADRIGVTTGQLQELQHAARLADIEVGDLNKRMQFFGKTIGEASQGKGEFLKVLEANNVALRDEAGRLRPTNELLLDYADLVKNAGSEAERLQLAQIAFGRGGIDMVTMLQNGAAGLRENAAEARKLGLVLQDDLLRKAEQVGDDWTRVTESMSTAFKSFVLREVEGAAIVIASLERFRKYIRDSSSPPNAGTLAGSSIGQGIATPTPRTTDELLAAMGMTPPPAKKTRLPSKADEDAAKAAGKQQEAYEKLAASLALAQANLFSTDREQAIANDLARLGTDATETQRASIELLSGQLFDEQKALADFNAEAQFFGQTLYDAFDAMIFQGESLNDVLANMLKALAQASLQAALLGSGPLASLFGTSATGGNAVGGILGAIFGGARAGGGDVQAGKAYVVGEKRPELFVPSQAGFVMPDIPQITSAGGGGNVNLNIPISISADGADPAQLARLREEVASLKIGLPRQIVSTMNEAKSRRAA